MWENLEVTFYIDLLVQPEHLKHKENRLFHPNLEIGIAGGFGRAMEKGARPRVEPDWNYHVFYLSYFFKIIYRISSLFLFLHEDYVFNMHACYYAILCIFSLSVRNEGCLAISSWNRAQQCLLLAADIV